MRSTPLLLVVSVALGTLPCGRALAEPATARVPRVIGLRVHEAERRLADAGFTVRLLGRAGGEGVRTVTAQHPAAGERARVGVQVRVSYRWSRFGEAPPNAPGRKQRQEVRVPRLQGLAVREAVRRLERVGLGADAIGPERGRSGRTLVVGQHPAEGVTVRRGAAIRITWRYTR